MLPFRFSRPMFINILQTRFADIPNLRECIDSVARE